MPPSDLRRFSRVHVGGYVCRIHPRSKELRTRGRKNQGPERGGKHRERFSFSWIECGGLLFCRRPKGTSSEDVTSSSSSFPRAFSVPFLLWPLSRAMADWRAPDGNGGRDTPPPLFCGSLHMCVRASISPSTTMRSGDALEAGMWCIALSWSRRECLYLSARSAHGVLSGLTFCSLLLSSPSFAGHWEAEHSVCWHTLPGIRVCLFLRCLGGRASPCR
ncbi:hypothetical protein C8F04DRAFT_1109263 [Mycena alexandri]|uniref:Uncharacterized protein n=1 Tax=Mycena alexandri TaxID=1745969 RepID=A0AAD6SQ31_9AGAR|nr:hypothetical protein C8F04DRAFT_1109263 [Mycena alexandri]